ncbi:MAG: polyprenol monophosphomannose synthase [Pirellulales bacterium]
MPAPPKTLVMTATYNEIENLPLLADEIFLHAPEVDLLVIDDNSPDGTGQWADERAAADGRLRCVHRAGKLGLGTATIAGMKFAIENGYDWVLNLDADFSHHPKYLPDFFALAQPTEGPPPDVVIGSRYVRGGGAVGWPLKRHVMSRGVNIYTRLMLGLKSRDCSGAFRMYRTELLKKLNFDEIVSRGYSFQEEILWRLARQGARFVETPIVFDDRVRGQSKVNSSEVRNAVRIIFQLGCRHWLGKP